MQPALVPTCTPGPGAPTLSRGWQRANARVLRVFAAAQGQTQVGATAEQKLQPSPRDAEWGTA